MGYQIQSHNAVKIYSWIRERGGLLIWKSLDLSTAGTEYLTPAIDEHGKPYTKPNWRSANAPDRTITDVREIEVIVPKIVKRFHVACERGSGFSFQLTSASSQRLRRNVQKVSEKLNKEAWYEFDYGAYENAVILVPDRIVALTTFIDEISNEQARTSE